MPLRTIDLLDPGHLARGAHEPDEPAMGLFDPGLVQAVHVGRRAAEIVDDAAPLRMLGHAPDLLEDGTLAAGDDPVALVKGQGAERTAAPAAAVRLDREPGHAQLGEALGDAAGERQAVDAVEIGGGIVRRGVLDDEAVGVLLGDRLAGRETLLGLAELVLVGLDLLEGRDDERAFGRLGADHGRAADAVERLAPVEPPGDLDGLELARPVDEDVGARVEEDGAADVVAPVIVVGEAPERGLDAAEDDPGALVELADPVGVDDDGPVGHPRGEGRVRVDRPLALERGVVDEHAVDRARGDAEEEPRPAELEEVVLALPVGALDDADLVAFGVEDPGDHPDRRERVIGVRLPADEDDVEAGS